MPTTRSSLFQVFEEYSGTEKYLTFGQLQHSQGKLLLSLLLHSKDEILLMLT